MAGPIVRYTDVAEQFRRLPLKLSASIKLDAAHFFTLGLVKKVLIADIIAARVVDPFFPQARSLTLVQGWLAALGYTAQLYFDFSGYSDIPLGGNKGSRERNLFLTMLLSGLWHGANWTFVLGGAYHGAALIFRAESISQAKHVYSSMLGLHGLGLGGVGAYNVAIVWLVGALAVSMTRDTYDVPVPKTRLQGAIEGRPARGLHFATRDHESIFVLSVLSPPTPPSGAV